MSRRGVKKRLTQGAKRSLEDFMDILRKNVGELKRRFKVQEIGVFGSYVRGEENEKSDLDVLVAFQEPVGLFAFLDLEEYLEELLGVKVDLVSRKALKPHIGKHILEEVVYIHEEKGLP
ncbi:MAG: nucleotidyltransferase family protein [Candidatus Caldatribacterium sp.]|nr:nucleotidyltransferase family protein [Candidatus Caldatribacterium sp.]